MTVKRRTISFSVSAEVGSSMMSTFASIDSALATSTICCSATPSWLTGIRASMATSRSSSRRWASR